MNHASRTKALMAVMKLLDLMSRLEAIKRTTWVDAHKDKWVFLSKRIE